MSELISVAVASRHRREALTSFVDSFISSLEESWTPSESERFGPSWPTLTILYDSPGFEDTSSRPNLNGLNLEEVVREVTLPTKSGLAELWNWCIMLAPTDWVLICNDDVTFNKGWLTYLEEKIAEDKYDMIHLFHYGAMCIHKSLILKLGWFDENFTGGGFEDIDYQLRISEAGLKDRIDRSHDFIRKEGKVEVGHFVNHIRDVKANGSWAGQNNATHMCEKWGRRSPYNYQIPSFRQQKEVDWHPSYRRKYEEKYGMKFYLNQIETWNGKMLNEELYL